jgi:hypothetical protein
MRPYGIKERILTSGNRVFWLAGLCLALLMLNAFLVMTLYRAQIVNSVHATLVPYMDVTEDFSMPRPLVREVMTSKDLNFITRSLIKEYINARYRVSGNGLDANECIFYKQPTLSNCPVLAIPSVNPDGSWTDAFSSLLDESEGGDRSEIFQLRAAGSTRAVRFLSEPRLDRDRWVADVEFIIRDRGVWEESAARRERFEINLDINERFDFRTAEIAMSYGPSSYFEWRVNRIWRFKR